MEEEVNFQEAREVILTAINLEDPTVYDQFNMRTIVCNNTKELEDGFGANALLATS